PQSGASTRWIADPLRLRRSCEQSVQTLLGQPVGTPSLRLLAEQTAKLLTGLLHVVDGLALLVDAAGSPARARRVLPPNVADWLPPLLNPGRAFVTLGAVQLFWIVTAWPNGAFAMIFAAIIALLFSPRGDRAAGGALAFTIGGIGGIVVGAIIKFAVLPSLTT